MSSMIVQSREVTSNFTSIPSRVFLLIFFGTLATSCSGNDISSNRDSSSKPDTETESDLPITTDSASVGESTDDLATDSQSDDEGPKLRGPCPPDSAVGALEVAVAESFSSVSGAFSNGVVPSSVPTLEHEAGECTLFRRRNPICDTTCESGQTCDFDGSCVPYPKQQDAGVITLSGLSEPVAVLPMAPTNSYSKVDVAHPAFESGDPIAMTSTNGYFGVMTLHGVGVASLIDSPQHWTVAPGYPLDLAWNAPPLESAAHIHFSLNIDQHGGSPLTLVCDFSDNGTAVIPAELIDRLINNGISGKPNGRLTRQTVDSQAVADGCVEFRVTSSVKADVEMVTAEP